MEQLPEYLCERRLPQPGKSYGIFRVYLSKNTFNLDRTNRAGSSGSASAEVNIRVDRRTLHQWTIDGAMRCGIAVLRGPQDVSPPLRVDSEFFSQTSGCAASLDVSLSGQMRSSPANHPSGPRAEARARRLARARAVAIVSVTSCVVVTAPGCQDSPLAPAPSADAAVVQFFVSCGQWVPTGAFCTAHGVYSDAGQRDLTRESRWESSDASVATVSVGRVTFVAPGEVTIRAIHEAFTASDELSTTHPGRP